MHLVRALQETFQDLAALTVSVANDTAYFNDVKGTFYYSFTGDFTRKILRVDRNGTS